MTGLWIYFKRLFEQQGLPTPAYSSHSPKTGLKWKSGFFIVCDSNSPFSLCWRTSNHIAYRRIPTLFKWQWRTPEPSILIIPIQLISALANGSHFTLCRLSDNLALATHQSIYFTCRLMGWRWSLWPPPACWETPTPRGSVPQRPDLLVLVHRRRRRWRIFVHVCL